MDFKSVDSPLILINYDSTATLQIFNMSITIVLTGMADSRNTSFTFLSCFKKRLNKIHANKTWKQHGTE